MSLDNEKKATKKRKLAVYPDSGESVLCDLFHQKQFAAIEKLIKSGVDPNIVGLYKGYPQTCLMMAIGRPSNIDMVKKLLKLGADPNLRSECSESTPLLMVSYKCKDEGILLTKLLLKYGADPNLASFPFTERFMRNGYKVTPLHSACENWNTNLAKVLLDNGADVEGTNSEGPTPLQVVINRLKRGEENTACRKCARLLLERGADVTHVVELVDKGSPLGELLHMYATQDTKPLLK